jgi:diguanylate cyclase (GGDEF)-like protein
MTILFFAYLVLMAFTLRGMLQAREYEWGLRKIAVERLLERALTRKKALDQQKKELMNDALRVFTLYELMREITQSLSDEEAFDIFKKKLSEHIQFSECRLIETFELPTDKMQEHQLEKFQLITLRGKGEKIGYLAIRGCAEKDKDTAAILGNQFALALRRIHLYHEIEKNAITDGLTHVYTRRYMLERFQEELRRCIAKGMKISFLMIDVDHFKSFNDHYGHLTGDHILREMSRMIKENIREIDIAGRYGGEEFCVVMPDTPKDGAHLAAERIRCAIEKNVIKAYDTSLNITVSVGAATFPDDGKTIEELIDRADKALYRAKSEGRNRVCLSQPE